MNVRPYGSEIRVQLTIAHNLANEDGNLNDGKEVDNEGYLLPVGPEHAQLAKPYTPFPRLVLPRVVNMVCAIVEAAASPVLRVPLGRPVAQRDVIRRHVVF